MDNHRFGTRAAVLVLLALFAGAQAFSEGAGGMLYGTSRRDWNPNFMPSSPLACDIGYFGGYGYGVDHEGTITGGFGLALSNFGSGSPSIQGGLGGLIVGQRVIGLRLVHLDADLRFGAGGLSYNNSKGYFVAYAEPYLELGIGLTPWLHLSATAGYQFIGNLMGGKVFESFTYWSPTFGMTIGFGSFSRR
jgi:hypothetical protein